MRKIIFAFVFCALFSSLCMGANLKESAFFKDVNSTCPIKFIDVFKAPRWIAALEYTDGEKVLLSSPKQMFHYMYEISANEHVAPIKKIYVTDYKNEELMDASDAFYVFGSRIVSASGDDLIPFSTLSDAQEFSREYSGHKILEFKDIKQRLIEYLE